MRALLLALFACVGSAAFAASLDDELRTCMKIKDNTQRLACFDTLTIKRAFETPAEPGAASDESVVENKGAWSVTEDISKIDDTKNVFLSVKSLEDVRDRFGRPKRPTLNIRCFEQKTDFIIRFDGLFMSDIDGHGDVTYRIDKLAPKTRRFHVSNNNESLGLWAAAGQPIPFIKALFGKNTLLVRATPHNENSVTAEFPIAGIETAITPLREACGW